MTTDAGELIDCAAYGADHCPHLRRVYERLQSVESMLAKNTKDTSEIVEILQAAKGFFTVASWVGNAAKWIVSVGVAIGAIWLTLRGDKV